MNNRWSIKYLASSAGYDLTDAECWGPCMDDHDR